MLLIDSFKRTCSIRYLKMLCPGDLKTFLITYIEEEDDEQLFDNELVVVNGSVAEFVSIWHETDCD